VIRSAAFLSFPPYNSLIHIPQAPGAGGGGVSFALLLTNKHVKGSTRAKKTQGLLVRLYDADTEAGL
jgi:hypothetical protein